MPLRKGSWRCRQSLSRAGERMARSVALGAASGRVFTCVGDVSTRHHAKKPWKSPPHEGRRAGGCTTCGQLLLVRARPGLSKALYLGLEGKAKKKKKKPCQGNVFKLCGEASAGEAPACLLGVCAVDRNLAQRFFCHSAGLSKAGLRKSERKTTQLHVSFVSRVLLLADCTV